MTFKFGTHAVHNLGFPIMVHVKSENNFPTRYANIGVSTMCSDVRHKFLRSISARIGTIIATFSTKENSVTSCAKHGYAIRLAMVREIHKHFPFLALVTHKYYNVIEFADRRIYLIFCNIKKYKCVYLGAQLSYHNKPT